MKQAILLVLAALVALSPATAGGPARQGDDGANVLFRLELADGEGRWPIQALVLDGQRLRTTTGWRVPTATEFSETSTSIDYQNVGMGVTLHVRVVSPGRVRVSGEVDLGTIDPEHEARSARPTAPKVATFRHVFDVILTDATATTLAEVPKPGGGSMVLTATADIQG